MVTDSEDKGTLTINLSKSLNPLTVDLLHGVDLMRQRSDAAVLPLHLAGADANVYQLKFKSIISN
jgi:hypothetical protein